jgi:hypothetical protein
MVSAAVLIAGSALPVTAAPGLKTAPKCASRCEPERGRLCGQGELGRRPRDRGVCAKTPTPRSTPCWRVWTRRTSRSSRLSCSRPGGGARALLLANPINPRLPARKQANSAHQRTSPMTTHDETFSTAFAPSKPAESFANWIKSIGGRIATCAHTCADYYATAAI